MGGGSIIRGFVYYWDRWVWRGDVMVIEGGDCRRVLLWKGLLFIGGREDWRCSWQG